MKCRLLLTLLVLTIYNYTTCVTISSLDAFGDSVQLGTGEIYSVAWCNDCAFLAAGGWTSEVETPTVGIFQVYSFDQTTGVLDPIDSPILIGSTINSVAWCDGCNFLAISGVNTGTCIMQVYSFDTETKVLTAVGSTYTGTTGNFYAFTWGPDCRYLLAGGYDGDTNGILEVLTFDPDAPGDLTSEELLSLDMRVNTIDYCATYSYVAVGGYFLSDGLGSISIFGFDPASKPTLSFITSFTVTDDTGVVKALAWCDDCTYLAAVGSEGMTNAIFLYSFDGSTLTLLQTITTDVDLNSVDWCGECKYLAVGEDYAVLLYRFDQETKRLVLQQTVDFTQEINSVAWCGECDYLATGGDITDEEEQSGIIQVLKSTKLLTPSNIKALKSSYRFPTQLDIANTVCWDSVSLAASYNVYGDSTLDTLLANIKVPAHCYSQHQIVPNTRRTYYVTAVDAGGVESESASVSI